MGLNSREPHVLEVDRLGAQLLLIEILLIDDVGGVADAGLSCILYIYSYLSKILFLFYCIAEEIVEDVHA